MLKNKIAIIVPGSMETGGVESTAQFLLRVIAQHQNFAPDLILLATAFNDRYSSRLIHPATWFRGPCIQETYWQDVHTYMIGANLTEIEFQHYLPRKKLTNLLNTYDLVQLVCGTSAWAYTLRDVKKPTCMFVATTARKERTSRIRNYHGLKRTWMNWMLTANNRLEVLALRHLNYIMAESAYTRELLLEYKTNQDNILIGPPGVDTLIFRPNPDFKHHQYFLCVGRLSDPRKNVQMLFRAYHQVVQSISEPPRLVLAGKSPPVDADWQLAKSLGISDLIDIHINVSVPKLAELYRNALAYVLPSKEEGLGIVLLEAMASGIPVIATNCGGPSDVVTDEVNGYLIPIDDFKLMAEKMKLLSLNENVRAALARKSRGIAENVHSIEAAGQVYLDVYRELLTTKTLNNI